MAIERRKAQICRNKRNLEVESLRTRDEGHVLEDDILKSRDYSTLAKRDVIKSDILEDGNCTIAGIPSRNRKNRDNCKRRRWSFDNRI